MTMVSPDKPLRSSARSTSPMAWSIRMTMAAKVFIEPPSWSARLPIPPPGGWGEAARRAASAWSSGPSHGQCGALKWRLMKKGLPVLEKASICDTARWPKRSVM